jgi:pilus assembly protein CpaE
MAIRTALIIDPGGMLSERSAAELAGLGISAAVVDSFGLAALQNAFSQRHDLVLIAVAEPAARPLDLIRRIRDALPDCVVLGAVSAADVHLAAEVVAAGAVPWTVELEQGALAACVSGISARLDRRRAVGSLQSSGGKIITVLGAKGGVGKTTVAINLAVALASESHASVALVDADPRFGDVALALNLQPEFGLAAIVAALEGDDPPDIRELVTLAFDVGILPTVSRHGVGAPVSSAGLEAVLERLRRAYEFIVIDTGGAFCDLTSVAARAASVCILVTAADAASARDARLCARWLRDQCGLMPGAQQLQLLVNRAGQRGGLPVDRVGAEAGMKVRWMVQDDRALLQAMQQGMPAVDRYPHAAGARSLRDVARWFTGAAPGSRDISGPNRGLRARVRRPAWHYGR